MIQKDILDSAKHEYQKKVMQLQKELYDTIKERDDAYCTISDKNKNKDKDKITEK